MPTILSSSYVVPSYHFHEPIHMHLVALLILTLKLDAPIIKHHPGIAGRVSRCVIIPLGKFRVVVTLLQAYNALHTTACYEPTTYYLLRAAHAAMQVAKHD